MPIETKELVAYRRRMPVFAIVPLLFQSLGVADTARLAAELEAKGAEKFERGRYDEAARYQRKALLSWDELSSTQSVDLAIPHFNLAQIYLAQGKLRAAEDEARLARQLSTVASRDRISLLLSQLLLATGRYPEAERELKTVLPDLVGEDHATALNDLGLARASLRHFSEARTLLSSALAIYEELGTVGKGDGRILRNLALVCFRQGDLSAATSFYERAISSLEAVLGKNHPRVGITMAEYSRVLRKAGRKSEAKYIEHRAKTILTASSLPQTIDLLNLGGGLAPRF